VLALTEPPLKVTFACILLGVPLTSEQEAVFTNPSAVHDIADESVISGGKVKKRMSLSIILIDGFTVKVIVESAPFEGALDEAAIEKNEGTESIVTES
jgi:hypothetical protein